MNTSGSGLTAQRLRMDTISQNLANVNTTRGADGNPYRRKVVVFEENKNQSFENMLNQQIGKYGASTSTANAGVKVSSIVEDQSEFIKTYDPSHPDANEDGYVEYPNVNSVIEMTNLISATRSYEANVTALNAAKSMFAKALEIGR
jgi:flagellar basal-body rod protein FlgC